MKNLVFVGLAVLALTAGCGGSGDGGGDGGNGDTPTETSDATKATTVAVSGEMMAASGEATLAGLQNFGGGAPGMVVNAKGKEAMEATIDYTYNCSTSGTIGVTGTLEADCTGDEENASCTALTSTLALTFNDCQYMTTVDSTTYTVTMTGTASATITGTLTVSGGVMSATFEGSFTSGPSVSGDFSGTICLSNFEFSGSVSAGEEAAITCSGTAAVTLDSTEQVCGISSDCTTCDE